MRAAWVREVVLLGLVAFVLAYAWLFSAVSVPNERTRLYLTVALVDEGTLAVDGPLRRYGRILDLAEHDGHKYTDKAPGSSLLAVPVYAVARALHGEPLPLTRLINVVRTWLMVPAALLGFLLLRRLARDLSLSEPTVDVVSLGYALSTCALHYGTAFYGHVLVATLLLAVLWLLGRAGSFDARTIAPRRRFVLLGGAGAAAGMLGLVEYQAIVLAALAALPIALDGRPDRIKALTAYALGALPFAGFLLAYNTLAFGGPLELSYHHLVAKNLQELHGFGLAGATHPTWAALEGLFVSRHRGLFTTSPLMALGAVGWVAGRRRMPRGLWLFALVGTLYFVLIVASSSVWFGGWSFGPRLLLPIVPLLALGAGWALDTPGRAAPLVRLLGAASVLFGFALQLLAQVTFPELPPEVLRPLPDHLLPMLEAGVVAPNLACKLGPLAPANLAPLALVAGALALFVSIRLPERTRLRTGLRALGSLVLAALAFAWLAREAPSVPPSAQAAWHKLVRGWVAREQSCQKESP